MASVSQASPTSGWWIEVHFVRGMTKVLKYVIVFWQLPVLPGAPESFTLWRVEKMLRDKKLIRTNVMLDEEVLQSVDEFAKTMEEDRSTAIRQLIKKAVSGEKVELAVKRFQEGVPFRKAAEIAGLDYWDFQTELDKRGISISSSVSFARKRMKH